MIDRQSVDKFLLLIAILLPLLVSNVASAAEAETQKFTLELGDYRFTPATIKVVAGRPVELTLTNKDAITPHNLTLKDPGAGLDVQADVQPGTSVTVEFTAASPGRYEFYCDKKLLFMKSHREKGMEGELVVDSAP